MARYCCRISISSSSWPRSTAKRVPERQPHAKGTGAFGRFEVTNDLSAYTKAAVFQPGTKTDVFVRLSGNAGERGSADTVRDTRGFSVKFYTTEGNFDLVGLDFPVFVIRDPIKFRRWSARPNAARTTTAVTTTCSGIFGRSPRSRRTRWP